MKHYIAYHNVEKMGYRDQPPKNRKSNGTRTNRPVDGLVGSKVWCVEGNGKPRQYMLNAWYIVEETGRSRGPFKHYIQGRGQTIWPYIPLNNLPWFQAFFKSQGRFAFGLSPVNDKFVARLKGLSRDGLLEDTPQFPDEINTPKTYPDGALRRVTVNAYERNKRARAQCISHYGRKCCICDMTFGKRYGELFGQLIHVHHLRPLSEIRKSYKVNPIRDLRPICPNCHAVIHYSKNPAYTIEQIKRLLKQARSTRHA